MALFMGIKVKVSLTYWLVILYFCRRKNLRCKNFDFCKLIFTKNKYKTTRKMIGSNRSGVTGATSKFFAKNFIGVFGVLLLLASSQFAKAQSSLFEGYAIYNGAFYDLNAITANPDFQGANFTGTTGGTFTLGGQIKTARNSPHNICGGRIWYRLYKVGALPGAFANVALPFDANLSATDQQWTTNPGGAISFPIWWLYSRSFSYAK
jgi:hypothetical protein